MEEQFVRPDGRVFVRRVMTPSNDWLQNVMPALSADDMVETLGLSNLPERLLDELVNRFGYESVPSVAPPPATMTKEQYNQLRRRRVKKNHVKGKFQEESCSICLGPWKMRESVTTLPCGHEFHHRCVKKWLTKNQNKCPVCRQSIE